MATYLGVDPGTSGAFAIFGSEIGVWDIPTIRQPVVGKKTKAGNQRYRNVYDLPTLVCALEDLDPQPAGAVVETAVPFPGQDITATWAQAWGIAIWEALLAAQHIPCELVYSQRWRQAGT